LTATIVCILTTLLLLRRIEAVGKFSVLLWIGVLATLAIVIVVGLPHLKLSAFAFWEAPRLDSKIGYAGLGVALIYAVYDYLGYSRILYAAARDGNFFHIFAELHATEAHPYVATLFLGAMAVIFCQFNLKYVLQAILSIRAIIPFMAQIAGAVILRQRDPDRRRPFRMWLYPLPAITALGLWAFVVFSPEKRLKVEGLYVMAAGSVFYSARAWLARRKV